jgi:hypothetical protein
MGMERSWLARHIIQNCTVKDVNINKKQCSKQMHETLKPPQVRVNTFRTQSSNAKVTIGIEQTTRKLPE